MKISKIRIDGFGVWKDLQIDGLSGEGTVFYGPNEAGKTTLMQFVRALLYGFSAERRQRYLPPLRGGTPGGVLSIEVPQGHFEVARRAHREYPNGDVVITAPDGTQQGEPALAALLAGVDEAMFSNIYAFGLREIQELGTLSDPEAARHLYELSAGLDRVSLGDVQRELAASRERLLSTDGRPSQIGRLLAERERLQGALETSRAGLDRYNRVAAERAGLDRDLAEAEQHHQHVEQQARIGELAWKLRDKWLEQRELSAQLGALGPIPQLPERAIERLDELKERISARREKQLAARQRCRRLREEAQAVPTNEVLWRQAPRIEALAGQREWITSVESQISAVEAEAAELESRMATLRSQLGLDPSFAAAGQLTLSRQGFKALRKPARTLSTIRQRRGDAVEGVQAAEKDAEAAERDLAARLSGQGEEDLAVAMEKYGALSGQLRRRMQLDERIAQLGRQQTELGEQGHSLLDRQMLPTSVLIGLGSVFVLGTLLVLVGLLMPTSVVGSFGWALAILGLLGGGAAAGGKYLLERTASRELESNHKQQEMLASQLKQSQEERDELDRRLPRGGGPFATQLQGAERALAALEILLPLDARRQAAVREVEAARDRVAELDEPYRMVRRGWRRALQAAGLPEKLSPRQVRRLSAVAEELSSLRARAAARREEGQQRRRELAVCAERLAALAADAGVDVEGLDTVARLDRLSAAAAEQDALVRRRDELKHAALAARAAARKHGRRAVRIEAAIRELLREAQAESEEEFRRRVLLHARFQVLSRQHAALGDDISAAVANLCSEEELARELKDSSPERLEKNRQELAARVRAAASRLMELYEQRGRHDEQLRTLASDRGGAELRLEISCVNEQLRDAVARWQEVAVTGALLDEIRTEFERDRQPATLNEASEYLTDLTGGHYRRVWTPLGEQRLLVDDSAGHSLSPEMLSRGTREQLFLSLRLALVARSAQRGVELPLVLDDVLVNFDAERAKAAARVLRDFARAGHQLLVFTCHEHIVKMFRALKVETRSLPDNAAAEERQTALLPAASLAAANRLLDEDDDLMDVALDDATLIGALPVDAVRKKAASRKAKARLRKAIDGEDRDEIDDEFVEPADKTVGDYQILDMNHEVSDADDEAEAA